MRAITYTSQGNRKTLRFCKNRLTLYRHTAQGGLRIQKKYPGSIFFKQSYQQMSDMPTGISNRPNFVRIVNSLVVWTLSTGLVMWCVCFFFVFSVFRPFYLFFYLFFYFVFLFVFCFLFF